MALASFKERTHRGYGWPTPEFQEQNKKALPVRPPSTPEARLFLRAGPLAVESLVAHDLMSTIQI